jgi:HTH-type transcriptional regulator/antitoxin HigA
MEGVKMSNQVVEQVMEVWPLISNFIFVPHTEAEYDQVVALLDELIDEVGEDEEHPLASLMDLLGTLIEKYEAEYVPELIAT